MSQPLHILRLGNVEPEDDLVVHQLKQAGLALNPRRIVNAEEMKTALREKRWDMVISDYPVSAFDAWSALKLLQEAPAEIPFIVVSDPVGEAAVASLMKAGVHDVLLKDDLAQLPARVTHELSEAKIRRGQRQAGETRERLAAIVDFADDAIISKGLDGIVKSWNPAAQRIFGYRADEMIGQPIVRLIPSERLAEEAMIIERLTRGESVDHFETVRLRKDGSPVPVSLTISPIRDNRGQVIGVSKICRDLTQQIREEQQRRELEQHLMHSQKLEMLGTLAGGIAHDFNNQLTGISGCIEISLRNISPSHPSRTLLQQALRTSGEASDLVQRLLLFARRTPDTAHTPANLANLARELVALAQAGAPSTISFTFKTSPGPTFAKVDVGQFQQVLLNLCTNAVHAMGSHTGLITLGVRSTELPETTAEPLNYSCPAGPYVCVSVQDEGCGMDAATQAKIFDPFFTTRPMGHGTGLGLAIVPGIMNAHGGGIRVRSQRGEGTQFELFWPACAEETESKPAPLPKVLSGNDRRILIVDDEPVVAFVAGTNLRRSGFIVDEFHLPEEAWRQFAGNSAAYSLIIIDAAMPEISGFDLAKRIREFRTDLPLILMSGDIERFGPAALAELDSVTILRKPFLNAQLCEAVEAALKSDAPNSIP